MNKEIHIGQTRMPQSEKPVQGKWTDWEGEAFYAISNFDEMPPFFMSIVSHSDHWMYLSSKGSLTAGRANPELALFPYYTDDKIHDAAEFTGSKTILLVTLGAITSLWEPFSVRTRGSYLTTANLYKNEVGNKIIFEEVNHNLQLTFRYSWMSSDRFGWVRESTIVNHNNTEVSIELIDGLQNLLPYGVTRTMQGMLSTLVDAYKKSEMVGDSPLALFRLSSIPVDKAEPSEALKATSVWSIGLSDVKYLLSTKQLDQFRYGSEIHSEAESFGVKGAYLLNASLQLLPSEEKKWLIVAEVSQDASDLEKLLGQMQQGVHLEETIKNDIQAGTEQLIRLVAQADGLQLTADQQNVKRHFSNTMFNCMRGGIPFNDYSIPKADFEQHLKTLNLPLYQKLETWINQLPETLNYTELIEESWQNVNPDLIRLSLEYLPLMFSRRHGDPSRPWNLFNIQLKNSDGSPLLYYQGNWRDIFQNWEALAVSYPALLPGMIAKFLNATTIDGYNAYKITRDGIEWEILDPDDPWSNIGYWGDHQIIYLLKLLELSEKTNPGKLTDWLHQSLFAYANVPYVIKPYEQLVAHPQDTILFDAEKNKTIEQLVYKIGSDGKLIHLNHEVFRVNLMEKLLVPFLSKLSNFIPGAGIWMNTQRPEWNDANNALVGNGASMVTLYYMRRYVAFLKNLLQKTHPTGWSVSKEVLDFLLELNHVFDTNNNLLSAPLTNECRRVITDQLGLAGSRFRAKVYLSISGEMLALSHQDLHDFLEITEKYIDHTIGLNKRSDGLFHAYNLIAFSNGELAVRYLPEMLEGQVAILSSGYLNAKQALELLNVLRASDLYRPDQRSYMLYPNKKLPLFLERNTLSESLVAQSVLLTKLLENGDTSLIKRDENGVTHFSGSINNKNALLVAMEKLKGKGFDQLIEKDQTLLLNMYEEQFNHQSFTGRSGSFYKYEGLGSIYWHMVSKLLLSVSESINLAIRSDANEQTINQLRIHYNNIREGIGSHKSPAEYGAFPSDPYSHTPLMLGVQQPGMTGQVKEDILTRWFELGVEVKNGHILFHPENVDPSEFIHDLNVENQSLFERHFNIVLPESHTFAAFSCCHIPVLYLKDNVAKVVLQLKDDKTFEISGHEINEKWTEVIFARTGLVQQINVHFETKFRKL